MEVRAFIAADFDKHIRESADNILKKLVQTEARVNWVKPELMHLSLKFLGDHLDLRSVPDVLDVMREAISGIDPISIKISGLDVFPNFKRPRVIVAPILEETGVLAEIHNRIEMGVRELGFPGENRSFKPHLTLGRIREKDDVAGLMNLISANKNYLFGEQMVDRLVLYMSTLTRQGPEYSVLDAVEF